MVRCKEDNYTFLSEKPYVKQRILSHFQKSHPDKDLSLSDINLREIGELGIILTRIPEDIFKVMQTQKMNPNFWTVFRNIRRYLSPKI